MEKLFLSQTLGEKMEFTHRENMLKKRKERKRKWEKVEGKERIGT